MTRLAVPNGEKTFGVRATRGREGKPGCCQHWGLRRSRSLRRHLRFCVLNLQSKRTRGGRQLPTGIEVTTTRRPGDASLPFFFLQVLPNPLAHHCRSTCQFCTGVSGPPYSDLSYVTLYHLAASTRCLQSTLPTKVFHKLAELRWTIEKRQP